MVNNMEDIIIPSKAPLKRMHQIKIMFGKETCLSDGYKCFIDDLLARKFSRKTTTLTDASTWYLSHPRVYPHFATSINQ